MSLSAQPPIGTATFYDGTIGWGPARADPSMLSYYVDGKPLTNLKPSQTNVTNNGTPRGALSFANIYGFVLGGWNKHANLGNGAPTDDWIQSWQGGLDQFRLSGKALSASEVQALYNSKL